jgi:hypothetical protein
MLAAFERDARDGAACVAPQSRDDAVLQFGAVGFGGTHQSRREGARLDQRGRLRGADLAGQRDVGRQPWPPGTPAAASRLGSVAGKGRERAIAPRIAQRPGQFGMEREAAARQPVERAAAAPVERQEAAGLARGRASDLVALDHDRRRAAQAKKVGDGRADRAAAADDDPPGSVHALRH